MDEEVLDYDDFVEPVTSQKRLVLSREMAGEVQGGRPKAHCQEVGGLPRVTEILWLATGSGCPEDGHTGGVVGSKRLKMLELVQQSIAPSTRRTYFQVWLEFLNSGTVRRVGGIDVISRRQEDAVRFVMQQIEAGLAAVTILGCVGGPDKVCAVWIVGHSFVRWAEKQASSWHFGRQLGILGDNLVLMVQG
ncbi:hypothetical protein NDU88_002539 [Pleurodeles waltl]|uniref:Uncharacterized protein n=1 Tax=Pleurodeles waltl TaxID=8319 RepID=A0AAV7SD14_PLEWA|nr:hypothetical protein NDU88_002539 [Pleurodeles waltl]